MLVNGKWSENWQPVQAKDEQGRFIRQTSSFRNWITPDSSVRSISGGNFVAEPGRYHLYVAYICPWASRTLMVRALKKLQSVISISVVNPELTDQGWQFGGYPDSTEDAINCARYLHEIYSQADSGFTGRATVPVLWDKKQNCIVNNESADILRMLNSAFDDFTDSQLDLYPQYLQSDIDNLNREIYADLNNGVYQAGFATTQLAYEEAYHKVFAMLDKLETRLSDGRSFLFGNQLTETDIRLFVTLIRFDAAYYGLFKCNQYQIRQKTHLSEYTRRIYAIEGVAETVNLDHIRKGYYSIKALNPTGIVPLGPEIYF